jgi:ribosomal protein L3
MTKLSVGDTWYNTFTGKPVTVIEVKEHVLSIKTYSGFRYDYSLAQFLAEYSPEKVEGRYV